MVYISHKLSFCRFCDRILVLDQGELVQSGSHDELAGDLEGRSEERRVGKECM